MVSSSFDDNGSARIVSVRTVTRFFYGSGIELKLGDELVFGNGFPELISQVDTKVILTLRKFESGLIGVQSYHKRENPDGSRFLELEVTSEFEERDQDYAQLDRTYEELNKRKRRVS